MKLITGDECGLLKEIIPEMGRPKRPEEFRGATQQEAFPITLEGVQRVAPNEAQSRARGVVDMCWLDSEDNSTFAALRVSGEIQIWENEHVQEKAFGKYRRVESIGTIIPQNKEVEESKPPQLPPRPIALKYFSQQNRIATVDSIGRLSIVNPKSLEIVATYSTTNTTATSLSYTKGQYSNKDICTVMDADYLHHKVALSGRERETQCIDVETGKSVWKAKNLPPDPQTLLQQPVWTTALLFYNNHMLAAGTAYHQVRIYDARVSRRPIVHTPEDTELQHRVTSLCSINEHTLAVGDAAGYLHSFDIRTLGRTKKGASAWGRFVGPCGSIRQLKKHPTSNILACVGLDRMLRLFDSVSRKQLDCVYLKQRQNCVLFGLEAPWVEDQDLDVEDDVHDYVDSDNEEQPNVRKPQNVSDEHDENDDINDDSSSDDDDDDDVHVKDDGSSGDDDDQDSDDNDSKGIGDSDNSSDGSDDDEEEEVDIPSTKKQRT